MKKELFVGLIATTLGVTSIQYNPSRQTTLQVPNIKNKTASKRELSPRSHQTKTYSTPSDHNKKIEDLLSHWIEESSSQDSVQNYPYQIDITSQEKAELNYLASEFRIECKESGQNLQYFEKEGEDLVASFDYNEDWICISLGYGNFEPVFKRYE